MVFIVHQFVDQPDGEILVRDVNVDVSLIITVAEIDINRPYSVST